MTVYPNGLTTPPQITSDYMGYPGHNGTDSINHPGGLNYVTDDGLVVLARYNGSAGNEVRVRHDKPYTSRELHGRTGTFRVSAGDRVAEAQPAIATGSTGDSTGVHCHFEAWQNHSIANRAWPFRFLASLIGARPSGGGAVIPIVPSSSSRKDRVMRVIRQATPGQHYFDGVAVVGELTFQLYGSAAQANEWGRIWEGRSGGREDVTATEFHNALRDVNTRRGQAGLKPLPLP